MTERTSPAPGPADAAVVRSRSRRRWRTWLVGIACGLVALIVIVLVALRNPTIATGVVNFAIAPIRVLPGSVMRAQSVRGDWLSGLELYGVRVTRGDTLLIAVDTLRARYHLASMLAGRLDVHDLDAGGISVTSNIFDTTGVVRRPRSPRPPITLADILRGRFYSGPPLRVERLAIRRARFGGYAGSPDSGIVLTDIGLRAHRFRLGRGFSFFLDSLEVRGRPATSGGRGLALGFAASLEQGRFEARGFRFATDSSSIDGSMIIGLGEGDSLTEGRLVLKALPWMLRDLDALIPGLGLDGTVMADIDIRGTRADRLSGTISVTAERAQWGSLELRGVELSAKLTDGLAETRMSAGSGGARADVKGWVRPFDRTPTYDLQARTDRLPAGIPGLAWWPEFARRAPASVALHIQGSGYVRPVVNLTGRAEGEVGRLDLDGRLDLTRGFVWTVRRLAFQNLKLARVIGDTATSALSGTLTASGYDTLAATRRMALALELGPSRYGAWQISNGRVRARMNGTAVGGSLRLETQAGLVEVDSLTGRWDANGTLRLLGARFRDLDLEQITRQPSLASRLNGTLSGQVKGLPTLSAPGGASAAMRNGRVSGKLRLGLTPSRFREVEISRTALDLSLAGGGMKLDGAIESAAGRIDLAAHARPFDGHPTYDVERARFADLDLAAWSGAIALRSRLSGSLTGHGQTGATGATGNWEVALRLDPSRMGGASLDGGEAKGTWSEGQGQVAMALRAGADTLSVHSEFAMHDSVPEGRAELSVPFAMLAAVGGKDSLESTGGVEARVSFVGLMPATATVDGSITARGSAAQARLDSLFAVFHLRRGIFLLDTLMARSNVGWASGQGQIAWFDTTASASSDLRLAVLVNDATPLRGLFSADTMAVDTATLDLRVGGPAGARSFDARGSVRLLTWNQLRLLGADGSARGTFDPKWHPERVHVEATLRRLRGLVLPVTEAVAKVDFDGREAAFDLNAVQDEHRRLHLVGRRLADSLGQQIDLDRLDIKADSTMWALTRPTRLDLRPGRLEVEKFELRSGSGRVNAHGVIDRRGNQDFRLEMSGVGLDAISEWLGRSDVAGTLNGSLALAGPAAAPRGTGKVELDLTTNGQPAGTVRSSLAWNGKRLELGGRFADREGDSLVWNGNLPLVISLAESDSGSAAKRVKVLEGDVDMRLAAAHFPLRAFSPLLDPRAIGDMEGTLDLDLRLQGSSHAVVGSGHVDVTGGVVPLPGLGVTYRGIELHGAFEQNRLVLRQARLTSEKGELNTTGEIRFVGVTRIEPKLHINSRSFVFVQMPDLKAIASGSVDVTGSLADPIAKGKVTIENSNFYLVQSDLAAGQAGSTVRLTNADLRMLEENFGDVKPHAPNVTVRAYEASDLDLEITLERNNWVRQRVQPKMSLALAGKFRLKKAPHGEPELFGRIEPIPNRGYVEQFARSFEITGGEVLLNGPMKDHRIDIQAQYKPPSSKESGESETIIKLDVEGSIEKMNLTLSSEPAMSEMEIISYIATGKSATDKVSSDASSSLAKDIGLSQVTGFAEEAAQEAIGLDVLQVRFDALQGATLVAGRYLDSQLYVGFQQPLQYKDSGSPTTGVTTQTSFEVEYAIYQWLVLNLQGETSKLRSFIRVRHAY